MQHIKMKTCAMCDRNSEMEKQAIQMLPQLYSRLPWKKCVLEPNTFWLQSCTFVLVLSFPICLLQLYLLHHLSLAALLEMFLPGFSSRFNHSLAQQLRHPSIWAAKSSAEGWNTTVYGTKWKTLSLSERKRYCPPDENCSSKQQKLAQDD